MSQIHLSWKADHHQEVWCHNWSKLCSPFSSYDLSYNGWISSEHNQTGPTVAFNIGHNMVEDGTATVLEAVTTATVADW